MILLRIAGLVIGTGFCVSAALALRRALRMEWGAAGFLVFLLLFTGIQSLLVLAAGLAGLLSFGPLTLFCGAAWIIVAWRNRSALRPSLEPPHDRSGILFLGIALAAFASFLIKTALLSPYTGDALSYHLPKIAEWVRAGRFVWRIHHDPRMWFPAGFELVETWWVVFLRHDALIELGGVQMALIAFAAVFSLAESFGVRAGLASLVYLLLPVVILNVTSCGNDLGAAAMVLAAYALVARGAPRAAQAFPLLLALGMKATGGFAAFGVLLFAAWRERPARELPRWGSAVLAGSGLILAAFWYLRNWAVAGHPFYPFHGIHGEFTWSPQQGGFDIDSLQLAIQDLPHRIEDTHPYESLAENSTAWGWAAVPLGLPALLIALREDRNLRRLAAAFAFGAAVTLCFVWNDGKNLRFVLWFPALLALAVARIEHRLWVGAALLACAVNVAATLVPYEARLASDNRVPAALGPDQPVAVVFRDVAFSYRLYNRDLTRRVVYPRSMEELRASGVKAVQLYEAPEWADPIRRWPELAKGWYEVR